MSWYEYPPQNVNYLARFRCRFWNFGCQGTFDTKEELEEHYESFKSDHLGDTSHTFLFFWIFYKN